jgi:PhzF family phenazine biosynthesis protein
MSPRHSLFCVDAFADRIGTGNPAGVCILEQPADPAWMQMIAREMNLSETAFVARESDGFGLRWFTPRVELDLCGHATLATAHILREEGYLGAKESARFFTKSGILSAGLAGGLVELDFPALPEEPAPPPAGLSRALGIQSCYTGKNRFDWLVEAETEDQVRSMVPDFCGLAHIPMRGVIDTARASTPGFDFVSRFFAPSVGVNEDPVTGSAHCCLAPHWHKKLKKNAMTAFQASDRGGVVHVRTDTPDRVTIAGKAVTVWKGSAQS